MSSSVKWSLRLPTYTGVFLNEVMLTKGSPRGTGVKNPSAIAGDIGDVGLIPGWEEPLEKALATHSSILA